MTDCADCKREVEEEELITVEYQIATDEGISLLEWQVPLCIECLAIRDTVMREAKKKTRKNATKNGRVRRVR
jgi:hypothetical protein